MDKKEILNILKPETPLEVRIISDPTFIEGVLYGKERSGHPEGKIIYHILEILDNINKYSLNKTQREKLRLITLLHDTLKNKVDYELPRIGDNHHSRIAKKFAEKYVHDEDILQVVEYHDDAYNIWKRANRNSEWDRANIHIRNLLKKINDVELYYIFYKCDNETGDKQSYDVRWFEKIMEMEGYGRS